MSRASGIQITPRTGQKGQSCRFADNDDAQSPAAAQCIDTDPVGDGWGWHGTDSCRVGETSPSSVDSTAPEAAAEPEVAATDCLDADPVGDDGGWDGSNSCQLRATEPDASANPIDPPAVVPSVGLERLLILQS